MQRIHGGEKRRDFPGLRILRDILSCRIPQPHFRASIRCILNAVLPRENITMCKSSPYQMTGNNQLDYGDCLFEQLVGTLYQ
ncbi:hypothetical protein SAY87_006790 [Trapa incisa]|uniref:Uncharacterized protein n=1 Tax=Trapa incisa TaxID=236973 RepID=A0AAN7PZR9_9MYRT|nr:hypothetical protein SAY87_006790 [Trapa incisa]